MLAGGMGTANRWPGESSPPDLLPNRLCWSPHLLISEFTQDLLNRLYWSRPPNINCDQTKYLGSKIWLKTQILGGRSLFWGQQVMGIMQLAGGDKYNHFI